MALQASAMPTRISHQSERFTIVHNGVIENYQEVKDAYLPDVELKSDTDTEIIVQLIAWFVENDELTPVDAFKKAIVALEGSYAIALMDSENPDVILAAKNKSPLLLGKGDGFNVICSDAMAMIKETNQFVELMDKEVATVTRESLIIENYSGDVIERDSYTAEIDSDDLEKGTYPYYMLKEIDEQPAVMRKILLKYQDDKGHLSVDQAIVDEMLDADRIYVIAAGTSYHAGLVGKELIEKMTHIPTEVHVSSEFGYHTPILSEKPFFIFISQSGETADSRQVLVKTNALGHPSLTVTNVAGSTLSRESNFTLLLHAGPEIAVASTKAYTAQIAVLAILSEVIGLKKGILKKDRMLHDIGIVANAMQAIVDDKEKIEELAAEYLSVSRNAFYIGRGMDYHVALEAALKLKEISYIQTEGFAAGELETRNHRTDRRRHTGHCHRHRKIRCPDIREATCRKQKPVEHIRWSFPWMDSAVPDDHIVIPQVNPILSPLVSVLPTQLLSYYCSLHRGNDVDKPRNLAKSVTVE
ncbi:MAG: glutamine--fructose-6-phosphate transaminase (isomerizing) [Alkalibacterium sp.]|nr:glutamine--fructose-6-phosphate transaminase (isomerizing) [Alkalibacterium sp.]